MGLCGNFTSFVANCDNLAVRKLVTLLQAGAGGSSLHFLFEIQSNITELLFDVTHDFALSCRLEWVTTLRKNLHQVVGQVPAGQIKTNDGMGKSVAFVDGNCVTDTITAVKDDTGCSTRGVERQHGLDSYIRGWGVERLEHYLSNKYVTGI